MLVAVRRGAQVGNVGGGAALQGVRRAAGEVAACLRKVVHRLRVAAGGAVYASPVVISACQLGVGGDVPLLVVGDGGIEQAVGRKGLPLGIQPVGGAQGLSGLPTLLQGGAACQCKAEHHRKKERYGAFLENHILLPWTRCKNKHSRPMGKGNRKAEDRRQKSEGCSVQRQAQRACGIQRRATSYGL